MSGLKPGLSLQAALMEADLLFGVAITLILSVSVAVAIRLYFRNRILHIRLNHTQEELRYSEEQIELQQQALNSQALEIDTLDQIVRVVNKDIQFDKVLRNLLLQGVELIPQAESGAFLVYDDGLDAFRIGAAFGYELHQVSELTFTIEEALQRYSLASEQINEGVFVVQGINPDRAGSNKLGHLPQPVSMLSMTFVVKADLLGFVIFDNFSDPHAFRTEDLARMLRFRDHAVPAFTKAWFMRAIQQKANELARLEEIIKVINLEVEFERVLYALLEQGLELIPQAEKGAFLILNTQDQTFRIAAVLGYQATIVNSFQLSWQEALMRYAPDGAKINEGVYILKREDIRPSMNEALRSVELPLSMLAMTIHLDGDLAGFIILDNFKDREAFSNSDIQKLLRFRDHAVAAFAKARYLNEIQAQKTKLEKTYELLKKKNDDLQLANAIIEDKNRDITDSIRYARRIQEAIMPQAAELNSYFSDAFVFYRPKDIVSGDFYWFTYKRGYVIFAVVDCTGHGVPGAFMSVMGSTLLNNIVHVQGILTAPDILDSLNQNVQTMLTHSADGQHSNDGMELGLGVYDPATRTLSYAGANRPLYRFHAGELIELRGDKFPIGNSPLTDGSTFTGHQIALEVGDVLYLTTDGYQDQFGHINNRKFTSRKLKDLLLDIHHYPMAEQRKIVEQVILDWMGSNPQTDDMLVMGIGITE